MNIFSRMLKKRKKYFRYDLFVNEGDGWKKFGDYVKYLVYEDIEDPIPGAVLRLYGVYTDTSRKEGFGRRALWTEKVESPSSPGGKSADGTKKEKPIEERLMEKIIENADFTGLKPSKMSVPFGKTGGSLDFEAGSSGYGEIPPLEFDGKLPAWMHPAAGAMITGLMDNFSGMVKNTLGGAISDATGIKAKGTGVKDAIGKEELVEEPPDMVSDLDDILEKGKEIEKEGIVKKKVK